MILFPVANERDQVYKIYLSQYKTAAKLIDTAATSRTFSEQMRQIVEKFPYFEHTTPRIMAVAVYMVASAQNPDIFDREKALSLIDTVSVNVNTSKKRELLVIDVARYYKRLLTPD